MSGRRNGIESVFPKDVLENLNNPSTKIDSRYRCPYCYEPVSGRNRKDGTCETCKHSRDLFPVNYKRYPKKKDDNDDDDYDYYEYD